MLVGSSQKFLGSFFKGTTWNHLGPVGTTVAKGLGARSNTIGRLEHAMALGVDCGDALP